MPSLKGGIVFYITERAHGFSTYRNAAVDNKILMAENCILWLFTFCTIGEYNG